METTRRRPPITTLTLPLLLAPLLILAISTILLLTLHRGSINIPFLWSQCHARSRIPFLSHIPLIGSPLCFITSFFMESVASTRGKAIMGVVLAFLAGLLTVSHVESGRVCNRGNRVVRYPTLVWVAGMVGGALVWEGVVVPAAVVGGYRTVKARREGAGGGDVEGAGGALGTRELEVKVEGTAVPVAVGVGCVLPGVVMMVRGDAVSVLVWLGFPIWVALVRWGVRAGMVRTRREGWGARWYLEESRVWTAAVYALPSLCSVVAQGFLLWSLIGGRDDRREMTRATTTWIEINVGFIALTVLYWLLIEAGWRSAVVMLVASLVLGPGAGVCAAWVYREKEVDPDRSVTVVAVGARSPDERPGEETPLLR